MVQKIQGAQRDFSFGEIDVALKRSDEHPARKAGLRQMANARILNSGAVQNRSGRRALYPNPSATRIEELTLSAGNVFKIEFGAGFWNIRNSAGASVTGSTIQGNGALLPWTAVNVNLIVYAVLGLNIYLTFPGMRPQVISWDGVSVWNGADYVEAVTAGGQKRTPFFRISPQNVTMSPSAITGAISLTFSAPIVVAGMAGTRMRYCGRQMLLGAMIDTSQINATVIEPLPPSQTIGTTGGVGNLHIGDELIGVNSGATGIVTSSPTSQLVEMFTPINFNIGDAVAGNVSGATGIVSSVTKFGTITEQLVINLSTGTAFVALENLTGPGGTANLIAVSPVTLIVQLLQTNGNAPAFTASEAIAGPSYSATVSTVSTSAPQAVSIWDEEVMNSFRGFPASCFVDQFRVGFCNFPAIPGGIGWTAINSPTDLYANDASSPDNAIFEIAPGKVQVYYVVPGPEGSEFIFCDVALYYIPISTSSPLVPGSVGFTLLSGDGAARVQPRLAQKAILYANAGQSSLFAVIATGSITQPFNTKMLSEFHQHLFSNIQCIAAPNADGTFLERYAYVLNGNGSIVVGKYQAESLQGNQPVIGWGPWSGAGVVSWIAAWNADVIFTSHYFGVGVCEILDDTQYLDSAILVNSPPAAFTAAKPAGKGPLWFIAGQSVTLMDQVTRAMGTYQIDGNGFIIPQNNGGENLAIASLVAGQPWTMTVEPFCPDANPGTDVAQRMMKRRVARFAAYVVNSTGFLMARLFSGPITPTSQADSIPLGTIMNAHRVPTWNQGDNPTLPPPLREEVQRWRPLGRSFDPRVAIIKDTPGPLLIAELGMEATI